MSPEMTDKADQSPQSSTETSATPVRTDRVVEQASRESFPASDPPSFTPSRSGKPDTRPDDVPLAPASVERTAAREWGETLCTALDKGDVDTLVGMLTEDVAVRIGSAELLVGHKAVQEWSAQYLALLGDTVHNIVDVRADGDAVFIESEVNVRTLEGVKLMRPEAISVRMRQGLASRLVVYGAPSIANAK